MGAKKSDYAALKELSRRVARLVSIQNLLEWDRETYMPEEGGEARSEALALLAGIVHKEKTGKKFERALSKLIDLPSGKILGDVSMRERAALREWRRDYLREAKIPASFVKKFTLTTSQATLAWAESKERDDFKAFAPHLKKIVTLCRQKAEYLGFSEHPYNALLDLYEPEMKISLLTPLFEKLKGPLKALVSAISQKNRFHTDFLYTPSSKEKQLLFGRKLLETMGFSKKSSRLDLSAHPFCSGIEPKDTRMTTWIDRTYLPSNIFSVIHEGGHGLYHQGLPAEEFGTPLGESLSLGIDESQSRWWETRIGRSLPFWQHFYPLLQEVFSESLAPVSLETFYCAINTVTPSMIRTEADEVTYNLHVIIRFEIERGLIEGTLDVMDLPEIWKGKMQEYLGIVPKNNAEGCLQDIHWSLGAFGYFPTYALGNLYAAQLFETFEKQYPQWEEKVASGDFAFICAWLHENIYRYGREFIPEELIHKVTGSGLSEVPFLRHVERKYKTLYSL